jgi:hypothetical protein
MRKKKQKRKSRWNYILCLNKTLDYSRLFRLFSGKHLLKILLKQSLIRKPINYCKRGNKVDGLNSKSRLNISKEEYDKIILNTEKNLSILMVVFSSIAFIVAVYFSFLQMKL